MANNYIQPGDVMLYANNGNDDVLSGEVVVFDSRIGIAQCNIPAGGSGAVGLVGVWALPKSSANYAQGQEVYWNGSQIVAAATDSTVPAGFVFEAAGAADDVVNVKLA